MGVALAKLRELPAHQALQGSRDNGSLIGTKTVASLWPATNDEALSLWAASTAIFEKSIRSGFSEGQAGVHPSPADLAHVLPTDRRVSRGLVL